MAIEGVKSFVAASSYQPVQTKVQVSEETADALDTEKTAVNQKVEIKKAGESSESQSQNQAGAEGERSRQQLDENIIRQRVKDINKKINNNTVAEFSVHEGTNRVMIKLRDKDTDEVIREIPAEKTLDLIQKAWELAGMLVDEKR